MKVSLFKIIRLTGPTKRNGLTESINEQNYNVDGLTRNFFLTIKSINGQGYKKRTERENL